MSTMNLEEYDLMKDAKYRLYVSAIDKALKAFESCNEWPDLISTLTKLNKVIKDYERFHVIPRRIKLSKRLAQCLHSDLPSGVHLKALETYDVIFKCMGTNRLSHELFIYSAGLFPVLGYSSINVKPTLLTVYETHFVPLGPRLLPGLSGFLNGVLPGLEDGSDHFDRTNSLLEKVCDGVGPVAFYGCLWECISGNAAVRLPAISFIIAHFNKKLSMEDQLHIVGTSVDMMVKALCCGIQDANVLVQRCSLDLLLVGFPMHNTQLVSEDMVRLVTAALSTILRRDMSLYRRVYAWFLGTEVNTASWSPEHPFVRKSAMLDEDIPKSSLYFEIYTKDYLIEGVKATLNQTGDIRPYRLLTSLLDRTDIGPLILENVLFDVFRVLYLTCQAEEKQESRKRKSDILKSANVFFNSLGSCCVWQYIGSTFEKSCQSNAENPDEVPGFTVQPVGSGDPGLWEICEITEFLLSVIPTEVTLDSPSEHLMELLLTFIALVTKYLDFFSHEQLLKCLKVCRCLLKKVQPVRQAKPKVDTLDTVSERSVDIIKPSVIRSKIGKEDIDCRTPTPESVDQNMQQHSEKKNRESEFGSMFKSFLKEFQIFYVAFIGGGRIINGSYLPKAFEGLKKSNVATADCLKEFLISKESNQQSTTSDRQKEANQLINDLIIFGNELWYECLDVASAILVEASAFPLCFSITPNDFLVLPPWVKTLLVCCCYLYKSPQLHMIAVRTLLELLQLCEPRDEYEEQVTTLLETSQIAFIQETTIVVKVIAETLWSHLGHVTSQLQTTCIQLLHMVLNTFTADETVEIFLGRELLQGDERRRLKSLSKFIHLWTVGRQLQDGRNKKYFQSSLLKILDNLSLPDNSPLRLQTEDWLGQTLMRGDITRLLEPLLLLLLDPATARLGILHVSIQHSSSNTSAEDVSMDDTSKVYAISSVDGNVIYHVSDVSSKKDEFQKRIKWRWKKDVGGDQKVFAVTSLKGNAETKTKFITEKNVGRDIEFPHPSRNNVSLFVNPLNARDDDDYSVDDNSQSTDSIRNARRFNPNTGEVEMTVLPTRRATMPFDSANHHREGPTLDAKFHLKKFLDHDCEESVSADEYFGSREKLDNTGLRIARDIFNSMVDSVVRKCESQNFEPPGGGVHPLHSNLLLYCGVYDSARVLYAFKTLKNIFQSHPRLFLCCSATSGIVNASFPSELLTLLARHRKSVLGRSFDGSALSVAEYTSAYRSSMYLQVLVSICLAYARSFYPNLGMPRLTADDLAGNRLVKLTSIETLTYVFTELLPIVRDSGKGFASYIAEVLTECKVQKIVLHCIMSSLSAIQQQQQSCDRLGGWTFTEEIVEFNDFSEQKNALTEHSRAMQVQLLKLILALIKLEHYIDNQRTESGEGSNAVSVKEGNGPNIDTNYAPECLIPHQPLFLRAVVSALSIKGAMRGLHSQWTELVTASLPYLGSALHHIVMTIINQLCISIEELSTVYSHPFSDEQLPPDYAVTQLEALTVLCHYCVLDSTQQVSPLLLSSTNSTSVGPTVPNPSQIFNNLVHVFTPLPLMQELSKDRNQQLETLLGVRRSVLSRMPRIIASLSSLWTSVAESTASEEITMWGSPRVVRSQILEFLSPISLHHGPCFLAAMAVTWQDRSDRGQKQILSPPTKEQEILVHLISSIRVMPIDTLVQTVHLVLKQPPAVHVPIQDLEVSVLELFHAYMQTCSGNALKDCWGSLLALLRDGLLLSPPALFLVLAILNEYVQRAPAFQEKKDQRDLQDITSKLVEACGAVAGACLEHTTWLRRNLSVRDLETVDDDAPTGQAAGVQQHSVQAQLVLAQVLAPLLDVSYGSQEKEKVAYLLISLMTNITPYLKNHQVKYASSFQACSQLLANLSGFPYTRKSWKKDAFDLFMDSSLFQMENECLPYWCTLIDNLMTHDQTTFRDLLGKISVAQSGFLFSSREQEYEQRAQLLKRLAFVIMCSETDQYCKLMRDIQDRLSESLKPSQVVPSIQAQVFFCFRVLLLRMSSHHVTSLWPIVISELVQVFTVIEQELTNETEEFSSHIKVMSTLEPSWVVNSSNGLNAHGHPHWLLLIQAAAKLLDLAVLLPAHLLPQFQMYRWAFIGDSCVGSNNNNHSPGSHDFIPHVTRISKLMDKKYGPCDVFVRPKEGQLLLTETQIDSLQQLHPFFNSLQARPKTNNVDMASIEKIILREFLEKMPTSPVH